MIKNFEFLGKEDKELEIFILALLYVFSFQLK
jgi:hypothetical protein